MQRAVRRVREHDVLVEKGAGVDRLRELGHHALDDDVAAVEEVEVVVGGALGEDNLPARDHALARPPEELVGADAAVGPRGGRGDRVVEHRPDVNLARGRVDEPLLRERVHVREQRVLDVLDRRVAVAVRLLHDAPAKGRRGGRGRRRDRVARAMMAAAVPAAMAAAVGACRGGRGRRSARRGPP